MKFFRLLFILSLVLVAYASAATYYIDYEAGDDANAGTSTGSPWKHYPMDTRATAVAAATTIVGGDVLAPKGGVQYVVSSARLVPNGTTGNRVIVDGALWGTGKAIETKNNQSGNAWYDGSSGGRGNVTFRNIYWTNFGGYDEADPLWDGITIDSVDTGTNTFTASTDHGLVVGDDVMFSVSGGTLPAPLVGGVAATTAYFVKTTPTTNSFTLSATNGGATLDITSSGSGTIKVWEPIKTPPDSTIFLFNQGGENITIEDCDFIEIGQWQNKFPLMGTKTPTGVGLWLQSVNNVLIEDCVFQRVKGGVIITATATQGAVSDVTVNRCQFTKNIMWCVDVAPIQTNAALENITISNSKFYDYLEYDHGNWAGFGEKPHSNGIFLRTAGKASIWTNIRIHGNEFFIDNPVNSAGGTADIFISEGPSALIYNNIFFKTRKTLGSIRIGHWSPMSGQVVRIYNNTFFSNPFFISTGVENRAGYRDVHFVNNIGFSLNSASNLISVHQPDGQQFTTLNRNLYFNTSFTATQMKMFYINGWSYATLANVQSLSPPKEANSLYSNPLFADTVGSFGDTNFRVLAGSPAIGMGENLSEYFSTDKDGNARPATGAWDVGAYVYDASPPVDSTAPTLLSATIDATGGQLTIVLDEPVQGVDAAHFAMTGHTLSTATGSGATRTMTITPAVQAGAAKTLVYTAGAGRTRDLADNLLASFSITSGNPGFANHSLETTPVPPRPGGVGPRRGNRIR